MNDLNSNVTMRDIEINLSQLEASGYFGSDDTTETGNRWAERMTQFGERDGIVVTCVWTGQVGAVPACRVDGLDWENGERNEETPEYAWFDQVSDLAFSGEQARYLVISRADYNGPTTQWSALCGNEGLGDPILFDTRDSAMAAAAEANDAPSGYDGIKAYNVLAHNQSAGYPWQVAEIVAEPRDLAHLSQWEIGDTYGEGLDELWEAECERQGVNPDDDADAHPEIYAQVVNDALAACNNRVWVDGYIVSQEAM